MSENKTVSENLDQSINGPAARRSSSLGSEPASRVAPQSDAAIEGNRSFIAVELRTATTDQEDCPVVSPDTPEHEIRRRAGEALGPLMRSMLGSVPLSPADLCVRSEQVTFAEVDGESVLLDLASGHYYSLNQPATVIWEMLSGANDLGTIQGVLCGNFQVDAETAWLDLTALVHNLLCEKLARLEAPRHGTL
jgi:hypothetical protein